ncbi:hypothetical protein SAMN02910451_00613 [Butyrivibrio hungatei]|uniref:DUF5082 domain-containing protein n=1 Tax=Butyrivibrio hungatei TaxID=185008 RepID=A0A1G5BA82_9FIRM|nr:hypothetical protein [Butyrivibrio hungatei]MEE3469665.1 hypothetical protein [Butyrivibrio hungatei]SCX87057.1 hypothetical protein SAMN02910451_00613 [Butyrivibrio hungatei]
MSRRGDIEREIRHNCEKIDDYRSEISDLQEKAEIIKEKERRIRKEVYEPTRSYDITHGDVFRGRLEREVEEYRAEICRRTAMGLGETGKLLSDIQSIIDRIYELIEELEHRNSELEAELCSLEDDY